MGPADAGPFFLNYHPYAIVSYPDRDRYGRKWSSQEVVAKGAFLRVIGDVEAIEPETEE